MSGDDRITSQCVLRRCFQLEILRRRCSIRSSNEKCAGSGLWPALPSSGDSLVSSVFITNLAKHEQGQTGGHKLFFCAAALAPSRRWLLSSGKIPPAPCNLLSSAGKKNFTGWH